MSAHLIKQEQPKTPEPSAEAYDDTPPPCPYSPSRNQEDREEIIHIEATQLELAHRNRELTKENFNLQMEMRELRDQVKQKNDELTEKSELIGKQRILLAKQAGELEQKAEELRKEKQKYTEMLEQMFKNMFQQGNLGGAPLIVAPQLLAPAPQFAAPAPTPVLIAPQVDLVAPQVVAPAPKPAVPAPQLLALAPEAEAPRHPEPVIDLPEGMDFADNEDMDFEAAREALMEDEVPAEPIENHLADEEQNQAQNDLENEEEEVEPAREVRRGVRVRRQSKPMEIKYTKKHMIDHATRNLKVRNSKMYIKKQNLAKTCAHA